MALCLGGTTGSGSDGCGDDYSASRLRCDHGDRGQTTPGLLRPRSPVYGLSLTPASCFSPSNTEIGAGVKTEYSPKTFNVKTHNFKWVLDEKIFFSSAETKELLD